jgi:hypothetical protein
MKPVRIARQRLANQRLVGEPFGSIVEVVERLGAVQAQDYAGAKWGVAQRTDGAADADVEALVADGTILRTHVLRPTWHFVAAPDLRWMLALTGPRVKRLMASYNRKLELTDAVFRRSNAAIAKALEGGRQLTRTELAAALGRARIEHGGTQRLAHIVMNAELDALICSGARRGKQFTYALLDERAAPSRALGRDESLAELARRYFTTRGPATAQDFSWWSGLTVGDAVRGAEAADGLRELEIEGRRHWSGTADVPVPAKISSAHLLPDYDEFFIGYRDRGAVLQLVGHKQPYERAASMFSNVIEIDAQLVGGWTRTASAKSVTIATNYLATVAPAKRRAVEAQAKRYGAFLGVPVDVVSSS